MAAKRAEAAVRWEEANKRRGEEDARKRAAREARLARTDRYCCSVVDGAPEDVSAAAGSQGLTLRISLKKATQLKPIKIKPEVLQQVKFEENLSRVSLTLRGVFRLRRVSLCLKGVTGTTDDAWGLREDDLFGEED